MLRLSAALHDSLDLRVALGRAVPLLRQLIHVDHIALAVSRAGTLYDYEWFNNTLPERFLGEYVRIADHDFVRNAVAAQPNRVLRDHEMLTRRELERHIVYTHSREAGANLEQVMAVMLMHQREWSSGLSLYRSQQLPFSDHEAQILQMVVPQLASAVRNSREHAALAREQLLEPAVESAGLAVVWVDDSLREVTRTRAASTLLERYFERHERRHGSLPEPLLMPLHRHLASTAPNPLLPAWSRQRALSTLRVQYLPVPDRGLWALVLHSTGLDAMHEAKLTPRLRDVAASLARGMSNEQIATRDGRVLATVKQQASDIYRRLGVRGRKGLIRLVSGLGDGHGEHDDAAEQDLLD